MKHTFTLPAFALVALATLSLASPTQAFAQARGTAAPRAARTAAASGRTWPGLFETAPTMPPSAE